MAVPIRIQIATYDRLTAEVIVEPAMVDRTFAAFARAKAAAGLPPGGAIMQRADLPRYWDVAVGAQVPR